MVDRKTLGIAVASALLAALTLAANTKAADDVPVDIPYRLRTVDWNQPGTTESAPYLAGYREIDPVRGRTSVYKGKFLAREFKAHTVMLPVTEIVFEATGGESDSEFVAVFCVPWFGPTQSHSGHAHAEGVDSASGVPAMPGTLLVALDGGQTTEVPVEFQLGLKFFLDTGDGIDYSLPVAVIADLPEGDHEVALKWKKMPTPFAVMVGAVPAEAESGAGTENASEPPGG